MNIVKIDEYFRDKDVFFKKHSNEYYLKHEGTSAEFYRKTYVFDDGSIWYEVNKKVIYTIEEEIFYNKINVDVELFEVEYWNTEDSESKVYYELWDVNK